MSNDFGVSLLLHVDTDLDLSCFVKGLVYYPLLCVLQVFLQHLSPLLSLPTFAALWLTILDFMDKYMHAGSSDLLVSLH